MYAEVGHAVAGMKREKANEILNELTKLYVDNLAFDEAPRGKPFEEIYDLNTLRPTNEANSQYTDAKEGLTKMGIDLH